MSSTAASHARDFDVDGDGYSDLVIGAPGESVGTIAGAGLVQVIRGSSSGPTTTGNRYWTQDTSGIADTAEAGDRFGAAVASGDFNSDGCADVAIAVPGEDVGTIADAGLVQVLYGTASGLTATRSQAWTQDTAGVPNACEPGDRFGAGLAAGDVNGDGYDDLVVGVPGEGLGPTAHAGAVEVLRGSASGLTATGAQYWSQDSTGIADAGEEPAGGFEEFGASLAVGDVNADGRDDVVIGVPGEVTTRGNGAVHVLRGGAAGLTATGSQFLTAVSVAVGWPPSNQPGLGVRVALADLNGDGRDDLVVGTPAGAAVQGGRAIGTVATLLASSTGTFSAATLWHLDRADVPGSGEVGGRFGAALAVGDLTGDGIADVAVGSPGGTVGAARDAGSVRLLLGSRTGVGAAPAVISQDAGTVPNAAELGDLFGASLVVGHLSSRAAGWLVVGSPGEGVGTMTAEGTVTLLPGGTSGPDVTAAQVLEQDSTNVSGTGENFDMWATLDGTGAAPGPQVPQGLAARVVSVLPTSSKVVALTFDCGASDAGVSSILATLASRGVQATFFVTGDFAAAYPASVRAITAGGHRIGNHSATHPDLTTLTIPAQVSQLLRAETAVRSLTARPTLPWFRFPYGASDATTRATVAAEGFAAIGWTVDTLGWRGTSGGQSVATVVSRTVSAARPGELVLMHVGANPDDGSTLDAAALPTVISRLAALGYTFVTVDSALR